MKGYPCPQWNRYRNQDLIDDGILEIGDGYRAKNSEMDVTGLPFARAGNLNNGFNFENADLLCENSVAKAREKVSQVNDSVITTKGTFGRVAYVRPETKAFVYTPQLCYWRIKDPSAIDPRFLYYWLQGPDFLSQAHQIKSSTDMADYASLGDQRKMSMTAPSLPIQKKIAAILSAYDELIENNQRRIAILETMAEEIYREWFVRMRFPGHDKVKMVKGVPEGWDYKPINTLAKFQSGHAFKSQTYIPEGSFGIVTIKNVHDGRFVSQCTDFIDEPPSNMKAHCLLRDGDILMSLTGNVGRVYRVNGKSCLLNQRVAKLEPQINKSSEFAYWFFRQNSIQQLTELIATGAAQQNLSPVKLGNQKVLIPSIGLIQEFESKTMPFSSVVLELNVANQLLTESRDLLLPRLISGKLDIEALNITFPQGMLSTEEDA